MKQLLFLSQNRLKRTGTLIMLLVPVLVLLTICQDLLKTLVNGSAFYLSESFMFSSFWWLFAPFVFAQVHFLQKTNVNRIVLWSAGFLLPVVLHLLAFPLLVWIISGLCYYHTYAITQTLQYTLSEHFYQLLMGYAVPAISVLWIPQQTQNDKPIISVELPGLPIDARGLPHICSLLIAEGDNRICIAVADIFYCAANTPYIDIHLGHKKYLHSETLKSLRVQLDNRYFVRIHKSTLVNLAHIRSYTSRHNGDYDVTMNNGTQLRVSRHYAADFKRRLQENTPLTR